MLIILHAVNRYINIKTKTCISYRIRELSNLHVFFYLKVDLLLSFSTYVKLEVVVVVDGNR